MTSGFIKLSLCHEEIVVNNIYTGVNSKEVADSMAALVVDIPLSMFEKPDFIMILRRLLISSSYLLEAVTVKEWNNAIMASRRSWSKMIDGDDLLVHALPYIRDRLDSVGNLFPALKTTMSWLIYCQTGEMAPEVLNIARMQSLGVNVLSEHLWTGPESVLQTHLLRRYASHVAWPDSALLCRAWHVFNHFAEPELIWRIQRLPNSCDSGLFWGDRRDDRFMVVNLPVLLGFWSMTAIPMDWWHHRRRLRVVEQVRQIAPEWFTAAYQHGVILAVVMDVHAVRARGKGNV